MDPYIEGQSLWHDFHSKFINYWREALAERLPDQYEARIDERFSFTKLAAYLATTTGPDRSTRQNDARSLIDSPIGGDGTLMPVSVPMVIEDEHRETYIRVLHRRDRSLVAVLELLSPTNKTGFGRDAYLDKRNALLLQDVHFVEVDLLVSGQRPRVRKPLPTGDYYAFVARVEHRPNCDVYAWTLDQRLPSIPIPLRDPDPDVTIDLQHVFSTVYERGRYARGIDYRQALDLQIDAATCDWIARQAARVAGG